MFVLYRPTLTRKSTVALIVDLRANAETRVRLFLFYLSLFSDGISVDITSFFNLSSDLCELWLANGILSSTGLTVSPYCLRTMMAIFFLLNGLKGVFYCNCFIFWSFFDFYHSYHFYHFLSFLSFFIIFYHFLSFFIIFYHFLLFFYHFLSFFINFYSNSFLYWMVPV